MAAITEGMLLWEPPENSKKGANITRYMEWLDQHHGLRFSSYEELWRWSVADLEAFWDSIWHFFEVKASKPYTKVLAEKKMPGSRWFPGAELNYVEHVFRNAFLGRPALIFKSELSPALEVSWDELYRKTAAVAAALRKAGVQRGDRIAAYMPNMPETVVAFLACASIGAIWSSCSLDFGTRSVVDRFKQIEPKVLFAADGYSYNGKTFDRRQVVAELQQTLPTLEKTVLVPYLHRDSIADNSAGLLLWNDLLSDSTELVYEQVPFEHPLWVLYSSGTTGVPKAIVQGHGGIVIEHLKILGLHLDLKPEDKFFWFTTTGWVMWNILVGGLLLGSTVALYDGSPTYPDMNGLWDLAEKTGMTVLGTSPAYIMSCMRAGMAPGETNDLSKLRAVGSTGSPLPPEGFQWIYERVKKNLWLSSVSGGTDVCSAFVGGCPLLPLHAGEMQCRCLGVKVEAFDEGGRPVVDQVGELVVTEPMPSMPLFFWNDSGDRHYRESYFEMYPGVWRQGDWIKITSRGSAIIYGRSDSTINRKGIRIGTSEIYGVVERMPEIFDSLVIGVELPGGEYYMPLFVVLKAGIEMTDSLRARISESIRRDLTPRHVPDEILVVPEVPRTLNGKKLEMPVKKILMGMPVEKAVNLDSMRNPAAIEYFVKLYRNRKISRTPADLRG